MKKNMGRLDRIIRLVVSMILVALALSGVLSGSISVILLVIALILSLTSTVGFCPIYSLLRLKSSASKT